MPAASGKYRFLRQRRSASTCVQRVTYNVLTQTMTLEFVSGEIYEYSNVDVSSFESLRDAASRGEYFNYNVRLSFPYRRIA